MTLDFDRRVLVTGGTGFLGRHVVNALLDRGYRPVVLHRAPSRSEDRGFPDSVQLFKFDLYTDDMWELRTLGSRVIHLAWDFLADYHDPRHVTLLLPKHFDFLSTLINFGFRQISVAGSCLEYGHAHGPIKPSDVTSPTTCYGLAKDSLRRALWLRTKNLSECTLQWYRIFYIYGSGQAKTSLVPQLERAIALGQETFSLSHGEQIRDFLPVESAASQILDIFEKNKTGLYNICSRKPVSVRRFTEQYCEERGSKIKLIFGDRPYPAYEPLAYWGV